MLRKIAILLAICLLTAALPVSHILPVSAQSISYPADINKSFSPTVITSGDTSRLSINIYNPNIFELTNAAWIDDLTSVQTGLRLADPVNLVHDCGDDAIITANPGATTISLSGGTVKAFNNGLPGRCTVSVDVTSTTPGNLINFMAPGSLTATGTGGITITNQTEARATLTVNSVQPPSIAKAFNPTTMWVGQTSVLEVRITNNDLNYNLTELSFTDTLPTSPTGLVIGSPIQPASNAFQNCGSAPQISAVAGGTSFTISNVQIPKSTTSTASICTVRVNVTSITPNIYPNVIPAAAISTHQGVTNAQQASAQLNVQGVEMTKSFSPASILAGATSTVTITLRNPTTFPNNVISLIDTLPGTVLTIVPDSGETTCTDLDSDPTNNITITAPRTISLTGVSIPAGTTTTPGSCILRFQVTAPTTAPTGNHDNTILAGTLQTSSGATNNTNVTARLTIYSTSSGTSGSKSFSPTSILAGANSRLQITISAQVPPALTNYSLTDTLPTGMTISNKNTSGVDTPATISGCGSGAVITADTNASTISLSGATITPGTNCVITVYVTANTIGSYQNIIYPANINNDQGRRPTANITSTLTVTAPPPVAVPDSRFTISKRFSPTSVNPNGISTLTITLQNTHSVALNNVSLVDTLPSVNTSRRIIIAPTPGVLNTCGGSVTAPANGSTITLAGGTVPAQSGGIPGICTIVVNVRGQTNLANGETFTNTIPILNASGTFTGATSAINPQSPATAQLAVATLSIRVVKGFNPELVYGGANSVLTVTLINPSNAALEGITFTDTMPTGMRLADSPNPVNNGCGGNLVALSGANSFSFSGGYLAAASTCTLTVNATMDVNSNLTNTLPAGAVTTANAVSNTQPAQASLTNQAGASVTKYFTPSSVVSNPEDPARVTLVIRNSASIPLTGLGLTDTLPDQLTFSPLPAPTNTCNGTFGQVPGTQNISLTGGTLAANSSCRLEFSVYGVNPANVENCIPIGALISNEPYTNQTASCDTLELLGDPELTLVKNREQNTFNLVGDILRYSYLVTNTGNTPLDGPVTVEDDMITAIGASVLCPDVSVLDVGDSVTCTGEYIVQPVDITAGEVINSAVASAFYEGEPIDSNEENVTVKYASAIKPEILPQTGFSPGRMTRLPVQPLASQYAELGDLWLEIPALNVQTPIVGVPLSAENGWDITWLGNQAGWLERSTFPTKTGNSVITGHIYNSSGQPGIFINLSSLRFGDRVIVHGWGQSYVYEIREIKRVNPEDISTVMRPEKYPWLTLLTCAGYDPEEDTYHYRIMARAVQVKIQ